MLIAHNYFTRLTPIAWWQRPIAWMARCQSRDYRKLAVYADGFDVRIWWQPDGTMVFRHGMFNYHADDHMAFFRFCDDRHLCVRLMLECRSECDQGRVDREQLEQRFSEQCSRWEAMYPNIPFYGGRNMYTWAVIHDFGWQPEEHEYHASVIPMRIFGISLPRWTRHIHALWPWLWAVRHNNKYLGKAVEDDHHEYKCYLFDYL